MNESREREEQIFAEALALPAGERPRFLDHACRGDAGLRQRIEALVQAHESAGGFMAAAPPPAPADVAPPAAPPDSAEVPGNRIGRYKLLQQIGVGGCGVVWMAEQEEPVRRRVALKIIKLGMDTKAVIARFEAERQALALMDHPNIAGILDAGATDTGRPFFVMELVRGVPITKYCDENNLPTPARLALFTQVCQAVQHAHQKGIIHRDLKPSNILVTLHDGVPVPKVIDFGIAKATQGRLTDQTLFTAFEQFIGTPAYMSPEQAEMGGIDIDTRSDIYSLGVLLYELLTGRPPFDPKFLLQAGLDEIRRIIREVEPPKPSTNLSTLGDADRMMVAKLHGTDPARLSVLLRGDLDWIVMKAMEKNRARRYETPTALAADITRHLHDEPVVASPPGSFYRLTKFIRRHRLGCAAAAAVVLVLVAGTVISTWQAVRATRAERATSRERARAADLLGFMLGDLRTQLAKVGRLDVLEAVGDKATAYFASREARDLDDTTLARQAKTLTQIGGIRMEQGRYGDAERAYLEAFARAAALAERNPRDGEALFARTQAEWGNGFVYWKRGELAKARVWFVRCRDTAAELVALDPGNPRWRRELVSGQHNLAALEMEAGNLAVARESFLGERAVLETLLAAAPTDLDLKAQMADVTSFLGSIAERDGDLAEAVRRYGEQVTERQAISDADPSAIPRRFHVGDALSFQAEALAITGKRADAQQTLARARAVLDALVAQDPTNRRWRHGALVARLKEAMLTWAAGHANEALQMIERTRQGYEELTAAEPSNRAFNARLAMALRLEAAWCHASGRADAAPAAARACELGEKLVRDGRATTPDIGECAHAGITAGRIAAAHGDADTALRHWERARALLAPRLAGARDWHLLDPAARVATLLGRSDEAQAIMAQLNHQGYVPLEPWPEPDPLVVRNQDSNTQKGGSDQ